MCKTFALLFARRALGEVGGMTEVPPWALFAGISSMFGNCRSRRRFLGECAFELAAWPLGEDASGTGDLVPFGEKLSLLPDRKLRPTGEVWCFTAEGDIGSAVPATSSDVLTFLTHDGVFGPASFLRTGLGDPQRLPGDGDLIASDDRDLPADPVVLRLLLPGV